MLKKIMQRKIIQNKEIIEYSIKNEELEVRFLNVGGSITKIAMASDNYEQNLVLNYEDLTKYLDNEYFLNALIGRTSNRIADGKFMLEGKEIQLDINDDPHNLHGGDDNLTTRLFEVNELDDGYSLETMLPHQKNGFPGNLNVKVYYRLVDNKLKVIYEATTDATTIVNLTQHAYFNLSGNLERTIYDHQLEIVATHVAEVDENVGFTGKLIPVSGTRFDFNKPVIIDPASRKEHYLFDNASGYNQLFILDSSAKNAITFKDLQSGRVMRVVTSEPACQFYASGFLTEKTMFENNRLGEMHLGACFETHKIPYDYQSQILRSGEVYEQETIFQFSVE